MTLLPPPSDEELLRRAEMRGYHAEQRANAAANAAAAPRIELGPNSPLIKAPRAKRHQPEYDLQVRVVAWCHTGEGSQMFPALKRLIAVPNAGGYSGGFKENMVRVIRARAAGVAKGFPDLFLPVPRGLYHGAMLELKREGERPAEEQWGWLEYLRAAGYYVSWYDRFDSAIDFWRRYMNLAEGEQ